MKMTIVYLLNVLWGIWLAVMMWIFGPTPMAAFACAACLFSGSIGLCLDPRVSQFIGKGKR